MGDLAPSPSTSTALSTSNTNVDHHIHQTEEELRRYAQVIQKLEAELKEYKTKYSSIKDKLNALRTKKRADQNAENVKKTNETLKTKWIEPRFPWSEAVERILEEKFRLESFRSVQLAAINAALSNKDVIVVMPTGGGKSLIYQIPAFLNKGYALVIIPLLSLAHDQLIALERYGIKATTLNSSTTAVEAKSIYEQMTDDNTDLKAVFVTPEMVKKSKRFMNNLQKGQQKGLVSRIVVDEVHCCSTWGHDFRPDYQFLGVMKEALSDVPFLGLTATATQHVIDDILNQIPLAEDRLIITAPFNRPNLIYQVVPKLTKEEHGKWIVNFIHKNYNGMSGIVYTTTVKEALAVATLLKKDDIAAAPYHADMETRDKKRIHEKWLIGKIKVIVATLAFGMGIDKPDVRFVIHYSMPRSMENFYQESGRAGRDGEPSHCILMFTLSDFFKIAATIDSIEAYRKAIAVLEYCINNHLCRRFYLAQHFNIAWKSTDCMKMCDICKKTESVVHVYNLANMCTDLQSIIENCEERLTLIKLYDRWTKHNKTAANKKFLIKLEFELIIGHLLTRKYLEIDRGFNMYSAIPYIKIGSSTNRNIVIFCIHPIGLQGIKCDRKMIVDCVERGDDPLLIIEKAKRVETSTGLKVLTLEDEPLTKKRKPNEQQSETKRGKGDTQMDKVAENHNQKKNRRESRTDEKGKKEKKKEETHKQKKNETKEGVNKEEAITSQIDDGRNEQEDGTKEAGIIKKKLEETPLEIAKKHKQKKRQKGEINKEETFPMPKEITETAESGGTKLNEEETIIRPREVAVIDEEKENEQLIETKEETFLRPKEMAENHKQKESGGKDATKLNEEETTIRPREVAETKETEQEIGTKEETFLRPQEMAENNKESKLESLKRPNEMAE